VSLLGTTAGKVAAVLVTGLVVSAAGIGGALATGVLSPEPPTVESVENEWGEITDERTSIQTHVVVNNPNRVGLPGVAGVSYDVAMNDVTVASGSSGGLSLSPGPNEVTLNTHIDNQKIPAWWASHINDGEQTTVSVRPSVNAGPLSKAVPAEDRTFETDMLSSFSTDQPQSFEVGGRTFVTVEETSASWGEATANETPLQFTGTVTNPNDASVSFSQIGYEVSMNDVTVAEGTTDEGIEVGSNATETIRIDAALDNGKLDEWWVSHLRNDEQTTLDVQVYAVVETDDGDQRVPLPFMSQQVLVETDILGGGSATTTAVEGNQSADAEPPTVESIERDWQSTDAGTRFATRVVVNNPNGEDSALSAVDIDADYAVALNDVTLVEDSQQATLESGRNELEFASDVSDETITRWWVSHVERGEQTELTARSSVVADLGFAQAPVALPSQNRTFETDMLSGFSESEETVEIAGRPVATLENMNANWGQPTTERTPMKVTGDVTNERRDELTIKRFGYEVTMNDVVLADNESHVGTTIPGESTRSIETTGCLDNGQIPAWWVSHLENGERSELSVSYYAVVEYGGSEFTVELDSMSYNETVETNAFGEA
jgi:LEA14-like dessication related protein